MSIQKIIQLCLMIACLILYIHNMHRFMKTRDLFEGIMTLNYLVLYTMLGVM